MPVTANLSKLFYERLGEEVANLRSASTPNLERLSYQTESTSILTCSTRRLTAPES